MLSLKQARKWSMKRKNASRFLEIKRCTSLLNLLQKKNQLLCCSITHSHRTWTYLFPSRYIATMLLPKIMIKMPRSFKGRPLANPSLSLVFFLLSSQEIKPAKTWGSCRCHLTTERNATILILCLVRKREMRSNVTLAVLNGIFVLHLERKRERESQKWQLRCSSQILYFCLASSQPNMLCCVLLGVTSDFPYPPAKLLLNRFCTHCLLHLFQFPIYNWVVFVASAIIIMPFPFAPADEEGASNKSVYFHVWVFATTKTPSLWTIHFTTVPSVLCYCSSWWSPNSCFKAPEFACLFCFAPSQDNWIHSLLLSFVLENLSR